MSILREYRHEWSARSSGKTELLFIPRSVIGPIVAANPAARAFVADRVAISSAGGLISHLFDLKSKVDKTELVELTRSIGVKRVSAGKEILNRARRKIAGYMSCAMARSASRVTRKARTSHWPLCARVKPSAKRPA